MYKIKISLFFALSLIYMYVHACMNVSLHFILTTIPHYTIKEKNKKRFFFLLNFYFSFSFYYLYIKPK